MEYSPGCVFSLAEKNAPIPGCTVSEAICSGETDVVCYSLAAVPISARRSTFPPSCSLSPNGTLEVGLPGSQTRTLHALDALVTPADVPVGMRTDTSAVYLEINIGRISQ